MAMASSSEEQRQNMSSASDNNDLDPVSDLLSKQGFVMLDGGLGTDLETLGYDISGISSLWSAYFLKNSPQVIAQVHRRFFDAGADVAITSSYQASFDGFKAEGIDEKRGIELLKLSIKVAVDTRDEWWINYCNHQKESSSFSSKRYKPLIAGSIGAYGASLPGAQEYIGNYKDPEHHNSDDDEGGLMTVKQLYDWHMLRLDVIGSCDGVDVLAIETIPSFIEAQALVQCLNELSLKYRGKFPKAWLSFSCRDEKHINDGTLLSQVLNEISKLDLKHCIIGFGINCTPFKYVLNDRNDRNDGLLSILNKCRNGRHVVVYPNSGECYDGDTKEWADDTKEESTGVSHDDDDLKKKKSKFIDRFVHDVVKWKDHVGEGLLCVGGCCRIGPEDINKLRNALEEHRPPASASLS